MRGLICAVLTASLAILTCGGCAEDTKGKKKPPATTPPGVTSGTEQPVSTPDVGTEPAKPEAEAKGEKATEEKEGAKPETTEPKSEKKAEEGAEKKPDEGKSEDKKPEEKKEEK